MAVSLCFFAPRYAVKDTTTPHSPQYPGGGQLLLVTDGGKSGCGGGGAECRSRRRLRRRRRRQSTRLAVYHCLRIVSNSFSSFSGLLGSIVASLVWPTCYIRRHGNPAGAAAACRTRCYTVKLTSGCSVVRELGAQISKPRIVFRGCVCLEVCCPVRLIALASAPDQHEA